MTNLFTLDNLREEADKQFAPVKIGLSDGSEVTLKNLLRLGKADRALVRDHLKTINAEQPEEETTEDDKDENSSALDRVDELAVAAAEIIGKVASDPEKLLAELDGDVGLIMQVLQAWMEGTQSGGSSVLAGLIDQHGGAIASDLLHYYGVDLRDLFHDERPLSPKWVLNLIAGLPAELEFYSQQRGGKEHRGWTPETYALADLSTSMRTLVFLYLSAHIDPKKSKKPEKPLPFPIPDAGKRRKSDKPNVFAQQVGQMLAAQRKRKAKG